MRWTSLYTNKSHGTQNVTTHNRAIQKTKKMSTYNERSSYP